MAYDSTKAYVSADDYLEFAGIDLDIELKAGFSDNPTKRVEIFIKNTQTWLYQYILTHYTITEWSDTVFKQALLWQIKYTLKYGEDKDLDKTAYSIMHQNAMINPSVEARVYRWY